MKKVIASLFVASVLWPAGILMAFHGPANYEGVTLPVVCDTVIALEHATIDVPFERMFGASISPEQCASYVLHPNVKIRG